MPDCCSTPPPRDPKDRDALRRSLLRLGTPGTPVPPHGAPTSEGERADSCCTPTTSSGSSCCDSTKRRIDLLLWGSLGLFLAGVGIHFLVPTAPARLHTFGHACHNLLATSWWGLLAGIVAVAVIGRLPKELVAAVLGRGGSTGGLLRAVGAGLLLDLCNHGILMVGMGLYRRGASLGQTLAFLIASPWNSLSLTLILVALIGWKWMLLFIALSMAVALIAGWLADRLVDSGKLPRNPHSVDLPSSYRVMPALHGVVRSLKPSPANVLQLTREGLSGSRMVLRWVLFGFVLTAAIRAFVPEEAFRTWFGPGVAGLFLTLLATTLLEVCSEGSSPIAADLLNRAHAPGNAFVFLMAGAATDYTEVMSLRDTTSSWKTAFALPMLTVPQVLLIGWLIDRFGH